MSFHVLTGCFLPATFGLDLPDSTVAASVSPELLLPLSSIWDPSAGAAALRAKTRCPRPFPGPKRGATWRGLLVYLEFPRTQHLDKDRAGVMAVDIFVLYQPEG